MGVSFAAHAAWVLVSVLLCCFIVLSQCAVIDQTTLRKLLLNLKGNGRTLWETDDPDPCKWKGVMCSNGDVTNLTMASLHLNGSIGSEIGLLQNLVSLDASNNSLTGSIPTELSNCTALTTVKLGLNKLSGKIPGSLGQLQNLQSLDLSQNQLVGEIPSGIWKLPKLENFSAYLNNLSGEISSETLTLRSVNLASNKLTGKLPTNMCASGQLSSFTLSNNQLEGSIPDSLGLCSSLSALRLDGNSLTGKIPESFGKLQNLVYFVANRNNLTGQLPLDISGWKNLSLLNLADNALSGSIPTQLSQASNLQELVLSNNFFSGMIPQELVQCKHLSLLSLSANKLTGSLPPNICSLPLLTSLLLDMNALSGEIPPSIGNCTRLLELLLGHNRFVGNIPPQIGNLLNLQISLNLSLNALTGSIPNTLGRLTKLVSLDLSYNKLSGSIPVALEDMSSLLDWNFSSNHLTGAVPTNGVFANSSAFSFANNTGLCGGPLQSCTEASSSSKATHNAHTFWKAAGIAIACALVVLLIVSGIVIGVMHKHYFTAAVDPVPPVTISRLFSDDVEGAIDFDSIKEATSRNANIISTNHFSTIYKAVMPSGVVLAAKKLNSTEKGFVFHQRKMMFELDKMWRFSHENIMQPTGFFLEDDLAIIVYNFVPSCSLSQKLHRNFESVLPWSSRYKIAIATAEGLTFLHHHCNPPMMHMDVSSSNIFLGPNLEVKVGDVEVAKLLDPTKHTGSISAVAGSFGYIAPEYAFTMRVTLASNVYSFGVVLLELLTGRRPVEESFGDGLDLVRWVHGGSSRGEMPEQILDARISAQSFASRQEMLSVLKVAILCTNVAPLKRPRMKKVLEALQDAKSPTEVPSPVSS